MRVSDSGSPATTATANFSITVAAGAAYSVLLNWAASPSLAATGYNVYRRMVSGSGYVKINPAPVAGLSFVTVANGKTYYCVLTSVDAVGDESGYSDDIQVNIP